MPHARKKVRCHSWGVISVSKTEGEGWDDVWISFYWKRRRLTFGPCLVVPDILKHDIETSRELSKRHSKYAESYERDIAETLPILTVAEAGSYAIRPFDDPFIPEIVSPKPTVDRSEAEKMLRMYLELMGVKNVKFQWVDPRKGQRKWRTS